MEKVKDVKLQGKEILVSFDFSSLFPSILVTETMGYLREFLTKTNV